MKVEAVALVRVEPTEPKIDGAAFDEAIAAAENEAVVTDEARADREDHEKDEPKVDPSQLLAMLPFAFAPTPAPAALGEAAVSASCNEATRNDAAATHNEAATRNEAARNEAASNDAAAARGEAVHNDAATRNEAASSDAAATCSEAARTDAAATCSEAARTDAAATRNEAGRNDAAATRNEAARNDAAATRNGAGRNDAAATRNEAARNDAAATRNEAARNDAAATRNEAARNGAAARGDEAATRNEAARDDPAATRDVELAAWSEIDPARARSLSETFASDRTAAVRADVAVVDVAPAVRTVNVPSVVNVPTAVRDADASERLLRAAESTMHKRVLSEGKAHGTLTLPELGRVDVEACAATHDSPVFVHVRADHAATTELLVKHAPELQTHVREAALDANVAIDGRSQANDRDARDERPEQRSDENDDARPAQRPLRRTARFVL